MAVLLGQLPSSFSPPKDISPTLPQVPTGLPSELLARRPDLLSAEQQLRSAAIRVGLTKVEFLPKFTLVGNAGYGSLTEDNLLKRASELYDYGPQLDLPIFSYRLRQSVLRQAKARYRESTANYQSTFLNAVREVDDSLLDLKSHTRELKLQLQTLESTTLSAQAAKNRYNTGLTDYFDMGQQGPTEQRRLHAGQAGPKYWENGGLLPSKSAYKLLHARPH